ncbi:MULTISPECIES: DUF6289 family protein [Nonomuraea]|jgi:hypothetical protein|uniref:DUF6289 family protein n=1 Tax=Nonomuraea TaxID=83681 RepID=UPI001CD96425|nr:DUF6289 family protein [Nonomuraea aurantiaca]MCA2223346.1 hypothetical protein [Nonomuraea aurantiaca]
MIRRASLAVLVALGALTVISSPAHARACMIDYHCETYYYSDSAHTTLVGVKYENCVGDEEWVGRRGSYAVFNETPC